MRAGDCIHFRGIQHERCDAGVRMLDVRDDSGSGPYRWPCIPATRVNSEPCRTMCPRFQAMTPEQEREQGALIAEAIRRIEAGECPKCSAKLTRVGHGHSTVLMCPEHGFAARQCRRVGEENE